MTPTCMICTNDTFIGLSMHDKEMCVRYARDVIQGIVSTATQFDGGSLRPRRRGTSIVERCAQVVEMSCSGCRKDGCQRCTIAAELRAAEDRIHADRDTEIAAQGFDVEELIDQLVGGLCQDHVAFGSALVAEWYGRREFLSAAL